ncbi:hypothetical protein CIB48_g3497 [Xylaria polymorpha]|nr:hypothetical protein CIB48_g3497 [Xylaria polymorpha]
MISLSAPGSGGATSRDASEWESFKITSSHNAKTWTMNCRGYIKLEYDHAPNEIDDGREEQTSLLDMQNRLSQADAACTQSIDHGSLYEEMRQNGIDYGNNFATLQELRIGGCQALGRVVIPDVAQCMPSGYQQPHTIHPATFDALMHIVLPLYFRNCTAGTAMLRAIEEVSVAADMVSAPGGQLTVCATLSPSGPLSGSVDVLAFQKVQDAFEPVVILRGQKFQGIATHASAAPATYTSSLFHDVRRPVKMVIPTPGVASSLCFVDDDAVNSPLRPDEIEIKPLAYALDQDDVDALLGRSENPASIGECAGFITALGSDLAHSFQVGDRVCCWNTNTNFASRTRVKGHFVQRLPPTCSFKTGSVLPKNLSLAWFALRECAQVEPGQTVLLHDAGGPLGHAVALVAKLIGVRVLATVRTEAEKRTLTGQPSTVPAHILYIDDQALPKALLRWTRGSGVEAVFNTSATSLPEELMVCIAPFGTIVDMHSSASSSAAVGRAIKYVSYDAAQLLRYRPLVARTAFEQIMSILPHENIGALVPVTSLPINEAASAFKGIKGRTHMGRMVLLADENVKVNIKKAVASTNGLVDAERIIKAIADLDIPRDQKDALLALIAHTPVAGSDALLVAEVADGTPSSISQEKLSVRQRLTAVSSMSEAREIILREQINQMASLVTANADQLDPDEPLVELGLDSLIAIEFKNWLGRTLGADLRTHDILEADGLRALSVLVAEKSKFIPSGLAQEALNPQMDGDEAVVQPGPIKTMGNGSNGTSDRQLEAMIHENRFVPNRLPNLPLPDINTLCQAFLTDVEAFASSSELANTISAIEEFKREGSIGRVLYDRAAARATDPNAGNWAFELIFRHNFLDRRLSLVPCSSFWFSHPLSKLDHSQAERAALLSYTVNNYRLKLEAGVVKPVMLNEQVLTTAFHPWIFNTVRIPCVDSDEIKRHPGNDYCVAFWKGNAFKVCLSVGNKPATYEDLLASFKLILGRPVTRSFVGIFTSDNRHAWAEARQRLQELDSQNAASVRTIEAAAFTVSLDEAYPTTAAQRGRQFHFGGEKDAANRWHDKSLQFVVCGNGISGTLGEHTVLDALTLSELNDEIASSIRNHQQTDVDDLRPSETTIVPESLPLRTDAALEARIDEVGAQFADSIKDAEHAYFLFEGYGSKFLRAHKLSPKSVFQMIVQLAAYSTYGYTPPCWETVNQAHYHLGRVDLIQVVSAPVAAFIAAARDASVCMADRRALLVTAIRAHVSSISKAGRNLGWERNFGALRALLRRGEDLPALFTDPVYKRVRPRVIISNCFETGMLEKGCMWRDTEAVWSHYEVYADSVYFSVVTAETGRATRFCQHLKAAAELVRQIILA